MKSVKGHILYALFFNWNEPNTGTYIIICRYTFQAFACFISFFSIFLHEIAVWHVCVLIFDSDEICYTFFICYYYHHYHCCCYDSITYTAHKYVRNEIVNQNKLLMTIKQMSTISLYRNTINCESWTNGFDVRVKTCSSSNSNNIITHYHATNCNNSHSITQRLKKHVLNDRNPSFYSYFASFLFH